MEKGGKSNESLNNCRAEKIWMQFGWITSTGHRIMGKREATKIRCSAEVSGARMISPT